jgi:hypothetical protein
MDDRRTNIKIPATLDKQIEDYRKSAGVSTWTGAMFELVRKGLEYDKLKGGISR